MTRRILTLTAVATLGAMLMTASSFGAFGAVSAQAQQEAPDTPFITTSDAAERIETDGGEVRVLASEAMTKGAFGVMDSVQKPGSWTAEHSHGFAESFFVVEGTLTVQVNGGSIRELPPGSYVFIPGGVRHAQGNKGPTPVRTLMTTLPTGMERAFRQRQEEFRKTRQVDQK